MKREPRHLKDDELALWRKVRRTATPLAQDGRSVLQGLKPGLGGPERSAALPAAKGKVAKKGEAAWIRLQPQGPSQAAFGVSAAAFQGAHVEAGALDRKRQRQLRQGKLKPQARLDLHGMTVAEARPALERFVLDAHARELRLVLVITGKGRPAPESPFLSGRGGILRRAVPGWLNAPPLSRCLLELREAHQKHGGAGAYYVFLKRKR